MDEYEEVVGTLQVSATALLAAVGSAATSSSSSAQLSPAQVDLQNLLLRSCSWRTVYDVLGRLWPDEYGGGYEDEEDMEEEDVLEKEKRRRAKGKWRADETEEVEDSEEELEKLEDPDEQEAYEEKEMLAEDEVEEDLEEFEEPVQSDAETLTTLPPQLYECSPTLTSRGRAPSPTAKAERRPSSLFPPDYRSPFNLTHPPFSVPAELVEPLETEYYRHDWPLKVSQPQPKGKGKKKQPDLELPFNDLGCHTKCSGTVGLEHRRLFVNQDDLACSPPNGNPFTLLLPAEFDLLTSSNLPPPPSISDKKEKPDAEYERAYQEQLVKTTGQRGLAAFGISPTKKRPVQLDLDGSEDEE
ncbi:hypothetical protein JCM8547_002558 [Rhodosporidiobolus lusitaniae]